MTEVCDHHLKIHERDVEELVKNNLSKLNRNLEIVEQQKDVDSGRLDLLLQSHAGVYYVVEIKMGMTVDAALVQLLEYMADIESVYDDSVVKGILLAPNHHDQMISAVNAIPSIELETFDVHLDIT